MTRTYRNLKAFVSVSDIRGATAIEYGLIAAGIAVAIVAVVATVGGDLVAMFNKIAAGLS